MVALSLQYNESDYTDFHMCPFTSFCKFRQISFIFFILPYDYILSEPKQAVFMLSFEFRFYSSLKLLK